MYDYGMTGLRRTTLVAAALGGIALPWGLPALANAPCVIERSVVVQQGFTPTLLDVWAFPTLTPMPPTTVVRQVIVCPSVMTTPVMTTPIFITPQFFFDPPAAPAPVSGTSPGPDRAPAVAVSGVMPPVTVRDLAQGPGQYDRQVVTLLGTAAAGQESYDVRGALYTEFRLENEGASVAVLAWGSLGLREGQRVRVTGNFYSVAPFILRPGSPLSNVLEASVIETLR